MASGYEAATEDVRSLVASTLDAVMQRDRTFIAGASQALANWTAKYQHAMSQGKNQSMQDQLACWDEVREAIPNTYRVQQSLGEPVPDHSWHGSHQWK